MTRLGQKSTHTGPVHIAHTYVPRSLALRQDGWDVFSGWTFMYSWTAVYYISGIGIISYTAYSLSRGIPRALRPHETSIS